MARIQYRYCKICDSVTLICDSEIISGSENCKHLQDDNPRSNLVFFFGDVQAFAIYYNPLDFSLHRAELKSVPNRKTKDFEKDLNVSNYHRKVQEFIDKNYVLLAEQNEIIGSQYNPEHRYVLSILPTDIIRSTFLQRKKFFLDYFRILNAREMEAEKKKLQELAEKQRMEISNRVEEWIQSNLNAIQYIDNKANCITPIIPSSLSSAKLSEYLLSLITVEKNIYIITERLKELETVRENCEKEISSKKEVLRSSLIDYEKNNKEKAVLLNKITQCSKWLNDLSWADSAMEKLTYMDLEIYLPILPKRPYKPSEPIMPEKKIIHIPKEPVEPAKPLLQKAVFFNKRKIQEENDSLLRQHEIAMNKYYKAKQKYEKAVVESTEVNEKYRLQLAQYEMDHEQYQKELECYSTKLTEYQKAMTVRKQTGLSRIREEQENLTKKLNALMNQLKNDRQKQIDETVFPEAVSLELINSEIKQAQNLMIELLKGRRDLYSCDIIFGKYHDIVALSSFYEYFMSGRCDTLTGPNGAYNLYEAEIRANQIISQLADVVNSLEQIKKNQYMIYTQLDSANQELQQLNGKMSSMLSSLSSLEAGQKTANRQLSSMNRELNSIKKATSSISSDTAAISRNTDAIAGSNEVIAYNTAAATFYAKKNAELTNALGFLVALK